MFTGPKSRRQKKGKSNMEETQQAAPAEVLTRIALTKKKYGAHDETVLTWAGYLKRLPKAKREQAKYEILKPLPNQAEFDELRNKKFTTTVGTLIDDAFQEFGDLATELGDWYDSMPEQLQQGSKADQIQEAQQALENLSKPDPDENAAALQMIFIPDEWVESRDQRRSQAVNMLNKAADWLDSATKDEDAKEIFNGLAKELREQASEAESIEFPGFN